MSAVCQGNGNIKEEQKTLEDMPFKHNHYTIQSKLKRAKIIQKRNN